MSSIKTTILHVTKRKAISDPKVLVHPVLLNGQQILKTGLIFTKTGSILAQCRTYISLFSPAPLPKVFDSAGILPGDLCSPEPPR